MNAKLVRFDPRQTEMLGRLYVPFPSMTFSCATLELPWRDNEHNVSCIPTGNYAVTRYHSPSKGNVFLLCDVPERSNVEIHIANYVSELRGCIAVGTKFSDIDGDKIPDITNSQKMLAYLLRIMPDDWTIKISEQFVTDEAAPERMETV